MDYEEYTDSKKPFFIVKSKIKKKGNIPNVLSNEQISSKLSKKLKKVTFLIVTKKKLIKNILFKIT